MKVEENKILKELTTFKIGGPARFFCLVKNEEDIIEAVKFTKTHKIPFFILGGGSNILISDLGFNGLVMKMEMNGVEYIEDENGNARVTVKAGENWDAFVEKTVKRGLYGLENLSLIPGTVGAAPIQNIGAYGSEVKDTIQSVRVFDTLEEVFKNFSNHDCQFEYRSSVFKKEPNRYIVVSATFILRKDGQINIEYKDIKDFFSKQNVDSPSLMEVRNAVVAIRTAKLPDVDKVGTAGSFFKNPILSLPRTSELKRKYPSLPIYTVDNKNEKVSLAWILDNVCGYRGLIKGNVGTYKNQALVVVNNGGATSEEVMNFGNEMKKEVKEKTGIDIEMEVQYIG